MTQLLRFKGGIVVWLGFPILLMLTTDYLINQLGFLDPNVYAGYVHDYRQTAERFGQTYYSSRIAYIYWDLVAAKLLGTDAGYIICRFVMFAIAAGSVYAIAIRSYGIGTAVLATAWLLFIPWLPRSLLWTHYDGFAIVYLLVALALLVIPIRRSLIAHVFAGAAFSLAVNCNLFGISIGGAFAPSWWILYRQNGWRWMASHGLAAFFGFLVTYIALGAAYGAQFQAGGSFIEGAAFGMAKALVGGMAKNWFVPISGLLQAQIYIPIIPIVIFAALLALTLTRRDAPSSSDYLVRLRLAALTYLGSIIALEVVLHFVMSVHSLGFIYYLVYLLPASILGLIVLVGEWEIARNKPTGMFVAAAGLFVFWLAKPYLPYVSLFESVWTWVAIGVITIVAAALPGRGLALAGYGACTIALVVYMIAKPTSTRPIYDIRTLDSQRSQDEWDNYHGGIFLQQFVGARVPTDRLLGFWYGSGTRERSRFDSMQSFYLWGYSRLFAGSTLEDGMPNLNETVQAAIKSKDSVVLMGFDDKELDAGLEAMRNASISYRETDRASYRGKKIGYSMSLIEILPDSPKAVSPLAAIKLDQMIATPGSKTAFSPEGLDLTTEICQWCYSLSMVLGKEAVAAGKQVGLRVSVDVQSGVLGIAAADIDNQSNIRTEKRTSSKAFTQVVDLPIPAEGARIIIRNQSTKGPSRAVIRSLELFEYRPEARP